MTKSQTQKVKREIEMQEVKNDKSEMEEIQIS